MRALPSYWRGVVFRSRTEARWAVFFDAIRLRWEYEPEGFMLDDGTWYLPDFWIPEMLSWVEVKPRGLITAEEREKIRLLVLGSGYPCLLLDGTPHPKTFEECFRVDLPEGPDTSWRWSHFSDRYTVHRVDGVPRLFMGSHDHEAIAEESVEAAMARARSMDLTEPDAVAHLPLGWASVPIVSGDDGAEDWERDTESGLWSSGPAA